MITIIAVQQTPAKHLTDEELKQQYGIHMTSRIQEDGGGTEAKWADIDDDEDDWAPETIEWTDGTKVTLTHNDPAPLPSQGQEESKEIPTTEQSKAPEPMKIAAPKPTTSVGPNPTVLRLGANAERQAKAASISSRGTNDRALSGSTSPAPPPAKSPWAPLPPVERVSPVNTTMHPPPPPSISAQHRGPAHYPHREDAHHSQFAPKEIEADDFNRTWRESPSNAPRELYNSRSGRYEPVADTRRSSWRHDQGPRAPAVLQRPAHGEPGGPAEPSAAFQTHRSSHQEGPGWNRRRTSSNVSGGSGGFGRRMSFGRVDPPSRYADSRRGSLVNGMVDPALVDPAKESSSPTLHHRHGGPGWPAPPPVAVSSEASPVESQTAPVPVPEEPQEDPVVLQERIMKEKRMEARQRRLDQEEKERAAREERIRQKLEALGPAPEKKRKDSIESRKPSAPIPNTSPSTISSPPKPPVPEPTGAPKQYGMMKVHHPDTVKKLVAANERERASEKQSEKASPHLRRTSSPHHESPKTEPAPPSGLKQSPSDPRAQEHKVDLHGAQWRGNLNVSNSYAPWSTGSNIPTTSPSLPSVNNLWKPLSSDRTLGNGIFDQGLSGFSSREHSLRSQLGLEQPTMTSHQAFSAPQEAASVSPLPSPENRGPALDSISPIGRPGPIGPPSSQPWSNDRGVNAWNNFSAKANKLEQEEAQKFRQEFNARDQTASSAAPIHSSTWKRVQIGPNGERQSVPSTSSEPQATTNAAPMQIPTWKRVQIGPNGERQTVPGTRSEPEITAPLKETPNSLKALDVATAPVDILPFSENTVRLPMASVPARSSRFFPQAGATVDQSKRPVNEKYGLESSDSPPPPDDEAGLHPVYSSGSGPRVHLPTPKPVVKLPPKAAVVPQSPAPLPTFASMVAATPPAPPALPVQRAPPRPKSPTGSAVWQAKFDVLFGKNTSSEKKGVLAVASASKEPLDVQLAPRGVFVSLPHKTTGFPSGDGDFAARQVAEEEAMFEDREPGSQPPVRVPNMAPPLAWQAAPAPPQAKLRSKHGKLTQVTSSESFYVGHGDKDQNGNLKVEIKFPGPADRITVTMRKKGHGNPRHRNPSAAFNNKRRKPEGGSGQATPKKRSVPQQSDGPVSRNQHRTSPWVASGSN